MASIVSRLGRGQVAVLRNWANRLQEKLPSRLVACPCEPGTVVSVVAKEGGQAQQDTIMVIAMDGHPTGPLAQGLAEAGYAVCPTDGGAGALANLRQEQPSLIIVSGETAPDVYLALRQVTSAPILALLPHMIDTEVLAIFATGVDDCQLATIGEREVILRVRAILRRAG